MTAVEDKSRRETTLVVLRSLLGCLLCLTGFLKLWRRDSWNFSLKARSPSVAFPSPPLPNQMPVLPFQALPHLIPFVPVRALASLPTVSRQIPDPAGDWQPYGENSKYLCWFWPSFLTDSIWLVYLHAADRDGGVFSPKLSHAYLVAENSLRDVTPGSRINVVQPGAIELSVGLACGNTFFREL